MRQLAHTRIHRRWTPAEDAAALKACSTAEILAAAKRMGRSYHAIVTRRSLLRQLEEMRAALLMSGPAKLRKRA